MSSRARQAKKEGEDAQIEPPFGNCSVKKMTSADKMVPESSPADRMKLYLLHHRKWRRRMRYSAGRDEARELGDAGARCGGERDARKMKPTINHDDRLMPVAGGMTMSPVRPTGTLMYWTQVEG